MSDNPPLSSRLSLLRRTLGLNQTEFGAVAGVTKSAVSHWERGESDPTLEALVALQDGFGVNLDWLRFGTGGIFDPPDGRTPRDLDLEALSPRSRHLLAELSQLLRGGCLDEDDVAMLLSLARHLRDKRTVGA